MKRILLAVTIAVIPAMSQAALLTNSWTNTASGFWHISNNWSAVAAPTTTHAVVVITNIGTKTVTLDATTPTGNRTISNLIVSAPAGSVTTLQVSNAGTSTPLRIINQLLIRESSTLLVTNSAVRVDSLNSGGLTNDGQVTVLNGGVLIVTNAATTVGNTGSGALGVDGGTVLLRNLILGNLTNSTGTLTVQAGTNALTSALVVAGGGRTTGSVWLTGGLLSAFSGPTYVGFLGSGQMTVSNGTYFGQDVVVGNGMMAEGTLRVAGGSNVLSAGLTLGFESNTVGTAWLTGGRLEVPVVATYAGYSGRGQLTVSNGTLVTRNLITSFLPGSVGTYTIAGGSNVVSLNMFVANSMNTTGAVWLTGGELAATSNLTFVGYLGAGQMTISNGTASMRAASVGELAGSRGTLTLTGGGRLDVSEFLVAGDGPNATGTIWVTGGELTVTNSDTDVGFSGVGQMTISNGTVRLREVVVATNLTSRGTLTIAGGTTTVLSNLVVGKSSCLATGTVTLTGGELYVTNAASTALLEIRAGTLTQLGGLLAVDKLVITNTCGRFIHTGGILATNIVVVSPNFDADGDGFPNSYEQSNGFDPFDPADGLLDSDGDGQSNGQEFIAGTNPTNSASAFRILSVATEGINLRVTWMMGAGKTNALQRTAGGAGGIYSTNNFTDIFIVTNTVGSVTNRLDIGAATNSPSRYYRIRLVP